MFSCEEVSSWKRSRPRFGSKEEIPVFLEEVQKSELIWDLLGFLGLLFANLFPRANVCALGVLSFVAFQLQKDSALFVFVLEEGSLGLEKKRLHFAEKLVHVDFARHDGGIESRASFQRIFRRKSGPEVLD